MSRILGILMRLGLSFGLVILLGAFIAAKPAIAADQITLGTQTSTPEFQFIGTGTSVIDILLLDCTGGTCIMASGNGFGEGIFGSSFEGTYTFSSTSSSPFTLTCEGGGDFSVSQTTPINFTYTSTSGTGTLTGTANFTFATDVGNGTLSGTLTGLGGTFASDFPGGSALLDLTLANAVPLETLCGSTGTIASEIDAGIIAPLPVSSGACPLTQGFWKNHPKAWPVTSLTVGGVTLTEAQLITILKTAPKKGNATLILLHQLIAALLNEANGSIPPALIASTITDAQSLLAGNIGAGGKITYVSASSTLGAEMVADADLLDSFNNGAFSVGCSD